MNDEELFDALDGLHAWDSGCTDSGISDPVLRARARAALEADPHHIIQRFLVAKYPPGSAYTAEDWWSFMKWAYEFIDWDMV